MRSLVCALALLAAACTGSTADSTGPPPPPSSAVPTTTATVPPPTSTAPVDPCPAGAPGPSGEFTASGPVAVLGSPGGDAVVIAEIGLSTPRPGPDAEPDPDGCERLVIELATERGAPATAVGTTTVELIADLGILRVTLPPAVASTAVADLTVAGTFAQRAFVVQGDESLFVDVHLNRPVSARAASTRSPASIVVDLVAGDIAPENRPATGSRAVVLAPLGPMATYPIEVSGYARTDGPPVAVVVSGGDEATEAIAVDAPPYPWRTFTATVPSGPSGSVRLAVGGVVLLLAVP